MTCWDDRIGNLWLFGGLAPSGETYADLWTYSTRTNMWTWVAGPTATAQRGVYGTQGIADPSNSPPSRSQAPTWVDGESALWMFGGDYGIDDNGMLGALNDLWRFESR
jgi:hypothetical protein